MLCTNVKIDVLAPIPSARVMMAVVVNPGAFRSCRIASRKSASIRSSRRLRSTLQYENMPPTVPGEFGIMGEEELCG